MQRAARVARRPLIDLIPELTQGSICVEHSVDDDKVLYERGIAATREIRK